MEIVKQSGGCIQLVHSLDELDKKYLLVSDVHYDNPACFRKLLKYDMDEALAENAGIFIGGDLFCAMQGKYDPRRNKGDIEDQFNVPNYLDNLVTKVAEFLYPYRENIVMIAVGNHECLDDKTEILTNEGWKLFADLNRSESVATLNLSNGHTEWQKPTNYHTSKFNGKMHHLSARCFELQMTPNHRVVYIPQKINGYKVAQSSSFHYTKGSSLNIPVSAISGNQEMNNISDDELRILGWILSDGGVYNRNGTPTVYIYQAKEKVDKIFEILNRLKFEYSSSSRERTVDSIQGKKLINRTNTHFTINITGESKHRILNLLDSKRVIPDWMHKLSDRQFEIFLHSFIDGNGSRHKSAPTSMMAYGIKDTMDRLQAICITHGYRASLSTYRQVHYRLNITKHLSQTLANIGNKFKEVDYNGNVYCVTVPNGTIFVRKNGCVCITGNSNILNRLETDLTARLITELGSPKIHKGGYQGFIRFAFKVSTTSNRGITMYYHHGTPGGIISKGAQWVPRYASMVPDADIVWTGDSHDRWSMEHPQLDLTQNGSTKMAQTLHIKTGTYKQEFEKDGGWAIEKLVLPKAVGGQWLFFKQRWGEIFPKAYMT